MSVTIQLDLSEALLKEARENGLPESKRLGELLSHKLQRTRSRKELGEVLDRVRSNKGAFGFNAAAGEFEDLIKAGIMDPTKVVRTALQNAASVAGLLLTTEATVAEKPEEKGAGGMPPMPPGGGMGGMGGMM